MDNNSAAGASTDAPIRILMADDEPANLKAMQRALRHENFILETCNSGSEAIAKVNDGDYDLILLDILMPGISGLEACRKIHGQRPELPIIVMTAVIDDEAIQEAFTGGAADYLRKPVNINELVLRINNIITSRRAEARLKALYRKVMDDLSAAAEIQRMMLPDRFWCTAGTVAVTMYLPANQVSGDILDICPVNDHQFMFYVGDISGHGVQSALLTSAVNTIIRTELDNQRHRFDFSTLAGELTVRLGGLFKHQYMTMMLGFFDSVGGKLEYINCGHPPLLLIRASDNHPIPVANEGTMPIGWLQEGPPPVNSIQLQTGDILCVYTDGLIECSDLENRMPGIEGLAGAITDAMESARDLFVLPEMLPAALSKQGYQLGADDCTILALAKTDLNRMQKIIKVPPRLPAVGAAGKDCEQTVQQWTGNAQQAFSCELVVVEFLNNIIIHGFKDHALTLHDIYLVVTSEGDGNITISFYDHGVSWELPEKPSGDFQPELLETSGRGMNIIYSLADSLTRCRWGTLNRTTINMKKCGG